MHEPLTAEDLATFARLANAARRPAPAVHGLLCGCPGCADFDRSVSEIHASRNQLAELDAVGRLLAEVQRLRAELAADRAAVRGLVQALPECSWYDGRNGCEQRSLWDSYGQSRCNEHKDEPDDAREALRALQARMATWGAEAPPACCRTRSPRCSD